MEKKLYPEKPYPKNVPLGPEPIKEEKLKMLIDSQLEGWVVLKSPLPENPYEERIELFKEYKFKSFDAVLRFMGSLAVGCDALMHHPRWENIWRTLRVYTTTWDIGHKISDRDIQLARYFDREYKKFEGAEIEQETAGIGIASEGFVRHLKEDIGQNKLRAVGEKLRDFFMLNSDNPSVNASIQLLARIQEAEKKEILGTVSTEEIQPEYNKIREALLYIIDQQLGS